MLDKILGKKDKNQREAPDLHKNEKKSGPNLGGRIRDMVSKTNGMVSQPKNNAPQPNILISKVDNSTPQPKGMFSKMNEKVSKPKGVVPDRESEIIPDHVSKTVPGPGGIASKPNDKTKNIIEAKSAEGDNKDNKSKDNKDSKDNRDPSMKKIPRPMPIKDSKDTKDSKDNKSKDTKDTKDNKSKDTKDTKDPSMKKIPRPMPKPRPKERKAVKPSQDKDKTPGGFAGFGRRVPTKIPDDDRRTLIGAGVFAIILVVLILAGFYFFYYAPYQDSLQAAKTAKLNEVNAYYKGSLASEPQKTTLTAEINGANTPTQALAVDVLGPATQSWRLYQNQQIGTKQDLYGRVMINYASGGQKNLIVTNSDAQTVVNEADASVLANMEIKKPDTVAVPIIVNRLQAAGGLVNVGNTVDVYLNTNTTAAPASNNTTATQPVSTVNQTTPQVSGATVLAILRWQGSGTVNANLSESASVASSTLAYSYSYSQSSTLDVEQLLRASASGSLDDAQMDALLEAYGWRLSDFERVSNLGELDAQYLIMLEVPRENALWLIQNYQSVVLTVPTNQAPEWMIEELHAIYG